ncbi:MAG: hypothetical protein RH945_11175 [Hyphomonas sp.]|tara:strand:+ start:5509 stop:6045 length:537 start_codon:yes stop_codon:yes gene_type:complete
MMRFRIFISALCCGVLAACAFGSNSALIPAEESVLPLGAATVAGTHNQSADDPARWNQVVQDGVPETYAVRQDESGYWLDEELWLVFARLDGSSDEYLMQIGIPDEATEGGYLYNYAVGKLVETKLFVKFPDCDDLTIDSMNALDLDAECTITSYADLKKVIAETQGAIGYSTYYQLR